MFRSKLLYEFLLPLKDQISALNVLRYITFRAVMGSVTAFALSVCIGPYLIQHLRKINTAHSHHRKGFESIVDQSQEKKTIPTMGGLLILASVFMSLAIWADWSNPYLKLVAFTTLWMGLVGYLDDLSKLRMGSASGMGSVTKLGLQLLAGCAVGLYLYHSSPEWHSVSIPFLKDKSLYLGAFYVMFVAVVLSGSSNAVNLTDGLDGLAIGCMTFVAMTYAVLSYVSGHAIFAEYLFIPFIPGAGELTVFCATLAGASLGFLWFNSHPASVFMGDTGSLSLGGAIGSLAVCTKNEILLLIVGGVFVFEALSVILQVISYRFTGRRIFRMAPVHHHFQLKGWKESKIVIRFWILSIIFALIGIASLKLR